MGRTAVYNHFADKEVPPLAYMRQVTEEPTRVLTARPRPSSLTWLMRLRLYIRAISADDQPLPREGRVGLRR